jgi:hypothetical protein
LVAQAAHAHAEAFDELRLDLGAFQHVVQLLSDRTLVVLFEVFSQSVLGCSQLGVYQAPIGFFMRWFKAENAKMTASVLRPMMRKKSAMGQCWILKSAPTSTTAAPNPYNFAMNFFHVLLPGFMLWFLAFG